MNGVLIIDKPAGFTSFDVIAVVRRLTGQRKTGHTGTLDPNATGVLPVLLGGATKAQDILPDHDKRYTAGFRLGLSTDTLDIWGQVQHEQESHVTEEQLLGALDAFRGDIMQVPPMYSAVKKDGRRLYDLARQGVEVTREARPVTVHHLELLSYYIETQSGVLDVACSKGTYIRSLIDDLGHSLGTGAVMTALRRTQACGFTLGDSITLDELRRRSENGTVGEVVRPTESLFAAYPDLAVSDAQAKRFSNGGALDITRTSLRGTQPEDGGVYRVFDRERRFLGLGGVQGDSLRVKKLFCLI